MNVNPGSLSKGAALEFVLSAVETICQRTRASRTANFFLKAYYLLLCLIYISAYMLAAIWTLVTLLLLVGFFRGFLCLFLVTFIVTSAAVPIILIKGLSRLVIKRWDPPSNSSLTEIRAYHGTSVENAVGILAEGFRPSQTGMLGRGVYISRDINKVLAYGGFNGVILELRVVLGRVCIIDRQGHDNQYQWHSEYDTAWVPAKCGMVGSGLEEGCVAKPERIKVVRVWQRGHLQLLCLLAHELLKLVLDGLRWIVGSSWIPQPAPREVNLPPRPDLPDPESLGSATSRSALPCSDFQRFTHATVPPALAHKIKRG